MTADHHDHDHEDDFVLDLLGDVEFADIQVITEDQIGLVLGDDLAEHLMAMLGRTAPQVYTPKRGTPEYRCMLENGAATTTTQQHASGIRHLWLNYRWPGVVDYMEVLIRRICENAARFGHLAQDAEGHPRLDKILKTEQDEADLMETAVAVSNEPGATDHGYDFPAALEVGKELVRNMAEWNPVFQQAIDACADGHPEQVRPLLVRLAGLREDADRVIQGTLVLALASTAVADPAAALRDVTASGTPAGEPAPAHRRAKGRKRHN